MILYSSTLVFVQVKYDLNVKKNCIVHFKGIIYSHILYEILLLVRKKKVKSCKDLDVKMITNNTD